MNVTTSKYCAFVSSGSEPVEFLYLKRINEPHLLLHHHKRTHALSLSVSHQTARYWRTSAEW